MIAKTIGIIGVTGRMGAALAESVKRDECFDLGFSASRDISGLPRVFAENNYIVDFSFHTMTEGVLRAMQQYPKPLVLCTTGWDSEKLRSLVDGVSKRAPIVIAPNTSIGTAVQIRIARELAKILGDDYVVDILEEHHQHKVDAPSGTAKALAGALIEAYGGEYKMYSTVDGARPQKTVSITSRRLNGVIGKHTVTFASEGEIIGVTHNVLTRDLFASGAMKIVRWLDTNNAKSGVFSATEIFLGD